METLESDNTLLTGERDSLEQRVKNLTREKEALQLKVKNLNEELESRITKVHISSFTSAFNLSPHLIFLTFSS